MALIFVLASVCIVLVGLSGYAVRVVRDVEKILPDHDSPEAQMAPRGEELPPWGAALGPKGWTQRRKVGAIVISALLAALIVGLGWLQVKVLITP